MMELYQVVDTLLQLTSFSVTTPEIIYPFAALSGRYTSLLATGFNDDAVDDLLLYIDFSEDGVTPDTDLRMIATIPALASRILQVPSLGPAFVRVTAESGKAGHASVSGRRMMRAWRRL